MGHASVQFQGGERVPKHSTSVVEELEDGMFDDNILNICIYYKASMLGGDNEPETLFMHAYDHR